jgi:hypothetical protein
MSSKLIVIISTGEKEKASAGLGYAHRAMAEGWLDDVKVIFMGPSERLLVEDDHMAKIAKEIAEVEKPIACKFISDSAGISEKIETLGLEVKYVGKIISDYINEGYVPMVY